MQSPSCYRSKATSTSSAYSSVQKLRITQKQRMYEMFRMEGINVLMTCAKVSFLLCCAQLAHGGEKLFKARDPVLSS